MPAQQMLDKYESTPIEWSSCQITITNLMQSIMHHASYAKHHDAAYSNGKGQWHVTHCY